MSYRGRCSKSRPLIGSLVLGARKHTPQLSVQCSDLAWAGVRQKWRCGSQLHCRPQPWNNLNGHASNVFFKIWWPCKKNSSHCYWLHNIHFDRVVNDFKKQNSSISKYTNNCSKFENDSVTSCFITSWIRTFEESLELFNDMFNDCLRPPIGKSM